jgi:hypothetical protein
MSNSFLEEPLNTKQLGAVLATFGVASSAVGLLLPVLDAQAPNYWPEGPLAISGPVALVFGAIFFLKGDAAQRKFGHPQKPASWPAWLVLLSGACGALIFSWLRIKYGA